MTLLEVSGLRKSFSSRRGVRRQATVVDAVDGVDFEVAAGQTLALIGESGAGKSTTARLVARLIEPTGGRVIFDGVDMLSLGAEELRRLRSKMQMVFQDPYSSLDPRQTIGASVSEPLLVHEGTPRLERRDRAAELLERVGLPARYLDRYPRELSGGQLQRIAIARALITGPKLIICDEPVAALDVLVRAQVLNLLGELQTESHVAYLFITHDLSTVRAFAHTVAIMRSGQIVEQGEVDDVLVAPVHPYTKELIGAVPTLVPKALRV